MRDRWSMDGHTGLQPPLAGAGSQDLNPGPSPFPLCRPSGSPHILTFWGTSGLLGTMPAPQGTQLPTCPQGGTEREAWDQSCVPPAEPLPLLLAVGGVREEPFPWGGGGGGPWLGGCAFREPCSGPCLGFHVLLLSMLPPMRAYQAGRAYLGSDPVLPGCLIRSASSPAPGPLDLS